MKNGTKSKSISVSEASKRRLVVSLLIVSLCTIGIAWFYGSAAERTKQYYAEEIDGLNFKNFLWIEDGKPDYSEDPGPFISYSRIEIGCGENAFTRKTIVVVNNYGPYITITSDQSAKSQFVIMHLSKYKGSIGMITHWSFSPKMFNELYSAVSSRDSTDFKQKLKEAIAQATTLRNALSKGLGRVL